MGEPFVDKHHKLGKLAFLLTKIWSDYSSLLQENATG